MIYPVGRLERLAQAAIWLFTLCRVNKISPPPPSAAEAWLVQLLPHPVASRLACLRQACDPHISEQELRNLPKRGRLEHFLPTNHWDRKKRQLFHDKMRRQSPSAFGRRARTARGPYQAIKARSHVLSQHVPHRGRWGACSTATVPGCSRFRLRTYIWPRPSGVGRFAYEDVNKLWLTPKNEGQELLTLSPAGK